MPIEHLSYTATGRKFKVTEDGQDTGQRVFKTFVGQNNVDLGDNNFVPYLWDDPSQSIRYGNLSCEFYPGGYQVVREFGNVETLIDDQRFEVQYWDDPQWRTLDLWQIGLTVDQQEDYCVVTRNLSDGSGNILDVDYIFRPLEKVKNTFRLHVVDANLYRIRFQSSGIAGEVTEISAITLGGENLGIYKLLFDNIKFQWLANEIDTHSNYTIEDQAGGKKLDIFIGDFDLAANSGVVVSPDTWGPTTVADADDGFEHNDTTWYDDNSGSIYAGDFEGADLDAGFMWTVTDTDLPEATINTGTKITINVAGIYDAGVDGILKLADDRSPGTWGSSNRPSQLTKHTSVTVDWDEGSTGSQDSPELNSFIQQRIDGDDSADAFESGDKLAVIWENVASALDDETYWNEGVGDLTIVFTPTGTTTVNSDIESVFDVRSIINSDSEMLFDIANSINSDSEMVFDIANAVTSDSEFVNDIRGLVQSDSEMMFDIRGLVQSDIEAVFDIANTVNSDHEFVFDLANSVQSDVELVYDEAGRTTSDSEGVFDVYARMNSSLEAVFDVLKTVNSDSAIKYDMFNTILSDLEIVYDQRGRATSDNEAVFDVFNKINSDSALKFDIANSINTDHIFVYDSLISALSDVEMVFDVESTKAQSDVEIVYDVFSDSSGGIGLNRLGLSTRLD